MKQVAATYETWERVSFPFQENDKWYINVLHPKTGNIKKVRWYGEIPDYKDYSHIFGFNHDHITIFKGINKENHFFFKSSRARYSNYFGWYIVCDDEVPKSLPNGVEAVPLNWEEVKDSFKDSTKLVKIVETKIGKFYREVIDV